MFIKLVSEITRQYIDFLDFIFKINLTYFYRTYTSLFLHIPLYISPKIFSSLDAFLKDFESFFFNKIRISEFLVNIHKWGLFVLYFVKIIRNFQNMCFVVQNLHILARLIMPNYLHKTFNFFLDFIFILSKKL